MLVYQVCREEIFDRKLDRENLDRLFEKYRKTKKLTDEKIEHNIAQVDATLAMEGMPLTKNDKEMLRKYTRGEMTMEQIIETALARIGKD